MGAIQEPTPAMGPYRTEVRRESFYLTAHGPTEGFAARRVDAHALRVPADHAPLILAALDQVTGHNAWQAWAGTSRTGRLVVTPDDGDLLLRTDQPVYDQAWDDEEGKHSSVSTEIEYADVDDLRQQLVDATA
ncbi:hypothetical protein ABZ312_09720 [Streptomyces sp. NPDC006207]